MLQCAQTANNISRSDVGHVLGSPEKRSMLPEPERSLSPSGCALLRLLLHAVLVWSSSAENVSFSLQIYGVDCPMLFQNVSTDLVDLVHPKLPGEYLAQFFWEHLQKDLEVLSKALNLNIDDTTLIVHSVLRHISELQQYPSKLAMMFSVTMWQA